MTDPAKCPLCPRVRRDDRPLCSNHLRRVGDTVLERYFATRRSATRTDVRTGTNERAQSRLIGVQNQMILNATAYDQIRASGQRPFWNASGERWEDPVERARDIIARRHPHLEEGSIERLVAELFPPMPS